MSRPRRGKLRTSPHPGVAPVDLESILQATATKLRVDFALVSKQIGHNLSKGRVREAELVEELLGPYLPGNVAIAHGAEIVATAGPPSGECDIVIYDKNAMPFIDKSVYKVIPIEAVYMVIEVKSNLTRRDLKNSVKKIRQIKAMPKNAFDSSQPAKYQTEVFGKVHDYFPTLGFVFAYGSSNLASVCKDLERFNQIVPLEQRIDGIWVLDSGSILNWSRQRGTVLYASDPEGVLRVSTEDSLRLMLVVLHTWCVNAWMPPFRLIDYMKPRSMVKFVDGPPFDPNQAVQTTSPSMEVRISDVRTMYSRID